MTLTSTARSQSFTVEVFNATLPSTPTLRTLVGLWPLSGLVQSHGLSGECCGRCYINKYCCCSNNTAVAQLVKKYLRIGLQNRVTFSCLDALTPSPSEVALNPSHAWDDFFTTWGEFLTGVDLASGLRGAALTSVETPCNWGALADGGGDSRCLSSSGMTPQYLRRLIQEYDSRGLAQKLVFGAQDEPHTAADWAKLRTQAAFLRAAQANSSGTQIAMTATTDIGTAELYDAVDIGTYIPIVNRLTVKHGTFNCTYYGGTRCYPTKTTDCTGLPKGECLGRLQLHPTHSDPELRHNDPPSEQSTARLWDADDLVLSVMCKLGLLRRLACPVWRAVAVCRAWLRYGLAVAGNRPQWCPKPRDGVELMARASEWRTVLG
jgi:hypothetical protein